MKKYLFLSFVLLSLVITLKGQSTKLKNWAFKYEYLPERPLSDNYKTYKINGYSDATDNIPLDDKFVLIGEPYIQGLKNISVTYYKTGVMIGGVVIGGKDEKPKEVDPDLKVSILFKNIELLDKIDALNTTTNLQTNQPETFYVLKLKFKFPYVIRVTDVKTGVNLLDTLISTEKTAIFPNDYRFDVFGNRVATGGCASKPALDMEYNKAGKDLYLNSKKTLAQTCMNEAKGILTSIYGYHPQSITINYFYVKAKSKTFDVCDTTIDLMRSIMDTTTSNAKLEKHINWHCKSVKSDAGKLIKIWEPMGTDSKYSNEFTDERDKKEYLIKMKWNLVLAYLFLDDFEKALNLLNEIKSSPDIGKLDGVKMEFVISTVENLIKREIRTYPKFKPYFNYN